MRRDRAVRRLGALRQGIDRINVIYDRGGAVDRCKGRQFDPRLRQVVFCVYQRNNRLQRTASGLLYRRFRNQGFRLRLNFRERLGLSVGQRHNLRLRGFDLRRGDLNDGPRRNLWRGRCQRSGNSRWRYSFTGFAWRFIGVVAPEQALQQPRTGRA